MKSTSKINVSRLELQALVNKTLGVSLRESKEITEGWFNTIHRVTLENDWQIGLKIAPPSGFEPMTYEKGLLAAEIGVQTLLIQKEIPGTKVIASGTDTLAGEDMDWFMYEWIDGINLGEARKTMNTPAQEQADHGVAKQTARINSITGDRFGRWHQDHCGSGDWFQSFQAMVEDLLSDAHRKSITLPWEPNGLRGMLEKSTSSFKAVLQPRLVLWDLHDGNIIIDPHGGELRAIIDGDRALWADPLMEFPFHSFMSLSDRWLQTYNRHFDRNGASVERTGTFAQVRIAWYDLYLALVMVIETVYRHYPEGHDSWAREMGSSGMTRLEKLLL